MSIYLEDKIFYEAPTKFHEDLDALINTSTHTYLLKERKESNEESLTRNEYWDAVKYNTENKYRMYAAILGVGGIISVILDLFSLISWSKYESNYSIPAMICFFVLMIVLFTFSAKLLNLSHNQFFVEISNSNDEFYQFRLLPDNKLYIIGGANFDENGDTLAMNYITEMEPIYSDLIIMDSIKSITRDSDGTIIKGVATFRSYRINNGSRVYIELEKKQHMTIFIQDGIYPDEMLKTIADKYNKVI